MEQSSLLSPFPICTSLSGHPCPPSHPSQDSPSRRLLLIPCRHRSAASVSAFALLGAAVCSVHVFPPDPWIWPSILNGNLFFDSATSTASSHGHVSPLEHHWVYSFQPSSVNTSAFLLPLLLQCFSCCSFCFWLNQYLFMFSPFRRHQSAPNFARRFLISRTSAARLFFSSLPASVSLRYSLMCITHSLNCSMYLASASAR